MLNIVKKVWTLRRLVTLLSWVSALSGPTVRVVFGLGGPYTALSLELRGGGLESQFGRGPGSHDRKVVGWSCLCLGYKRGMCFWGTQLGALIHESPDNQVWLVYGPTP